MRRALLPLDVERYQSHRLHGPDRIWVETNCYVDLWIELLHGLDVDPVAALAFTLSVDFEGDQWSFFKYPLEDLRYLYGLDVHEMNVWLPLERHIEEQLSFGRLLTLEVDSWFLPDTAGVSYRTEHVKTSVTPNAIDPERRRLEYFHGSGYHELRDDDYLGALRIGLDLPGLLPPYAEIIRLDSMVRPGPDDLVGRVATLVRDHLQRRPPTNPVGRFQKRLEQDMDWLRASAEQTFHQYAFATLRQCGSCAELTASFLEWLGPADRLDLVDGADASRRLAELSKTVQFQLARALRGRPGSMGLLLEEMAECWDRVTEVLGRSYGG